MIPIINIDDFNYELPSDRIAKYPLKDRDQSRLLVFNSGNLSEDCFKSISTHIPTNSLLVFNNTKVIKARLNFHKSTGAKIQIFCLEPHYPATIEDAFIQTRQVDWVCIVGNQKKWKDGIVYGNAIINGVNLEIAAEVIQKLNDGVIIRFCWDGLVPFANILESMGQTPIPPYLERESEEIDKERYQTIYSKHKGSVAAPTAGLHFSPHVLNSLSYQGIISTEITLHVGAGTFKPVKSKTIDDHEMHAEHFSVPLETLKQILKHEGRVIAVGTTSVRTLESLYYAGIKLITEKNCQLVGQWDGFNIKSEITLNQSIEAIINYLEKNNLKAFIASTAIIIVPGFEFKIVNGLITNFHQPKSTLLLLIAALIGENWKDVYKYAFNNNFRFLSYGDSSLLLP